MGVFIKLVENRPPKEYAERGVSDIAYEDATEGDSEVLYEYDLLPSGALMVLQTAKGDAPVVHAVYAPGLWFRVEGQWHGNAE
ncbi:hypothetical protein ACFVXE_04985 [Streptomyces sp. NPDC058231]|uniref:hypothetical protein n=1 Tax=unclassified Streptomyces TaxID=2593676 RepID=UPI0036E490A4